MSEPSITLNAKVLGFIAALYLGYKEVRLMIEKQIEATQTISWMQKDIEQLKLKQPPQP